MVGAVVVLLYAHPQRGGEHSTNATGTWEHHCHWA